MGAYGVAGHIGIGKEAAWSTAVVATDYFKALSEGLVANFDRYEQVNIHAGLHEPDDQTGLIRIAGPVVAAGHPVSVGHFLNAAFGESSVTIVASGFLWTTAFAPRDSDISSQNPLPSYTFEMFRDVTSSQQYDGNVLNTLEMNLVPNQAMVLNSTWVGRGTRNIAKTTASFPNSPTHAFAFDTASLSVGGASTTLFESLTIGLDNQIEGIGALVGSSSIAKIKRRGDYKLRVSGTLAFEDITEYQKFINQTEQDFVVNMTKADSFNLILDLPRVVYNTFPPAIPGRERITIDFEGMARKHVGSNSIFLGTLTTTKSDY